MDDPWEQFREWNERIKALPEITAYIVLDHSCDPRGPVTVGHDAQGRKYVVCSPSLLDAMRHEPPRAHAHRHGMGLMGVPVYRREQMAEGWPDA